MKTLYVFDIDGTVTNTSNQYYNAFVNAIKLFGVPNIESDLTKYTHFTDSHILEYNLKRKYTQQELINFENFVLQELKLQPSFGELKGAVKFIENIEQSEDKFHAYATGSLYKTAVYKLQKIGLKNQDHLIAAANNFLSREEIVNHAISIAEKENNIKFDKIISLGDGVWDLKTAQNLNLEFIGIGEKNYEFFKEKKQEAYLDFSELA